ncbi:hypothetical protein LXA43DRAFT_1096440 [Ganoderma leucocontextum]|nr:hypothetical protein LXA43DRAFT_1096440 [Ganoderma leucocontextum]
MVDFSHYPAADALDAILEAVTQERWSMSLEMLTGLQTKLDLISSLVQETANSLSRIHRLPPEILILIFLFVSEPLSPPGHRGPSTARQTYDLLPIIQVCRRWRQLALGTPSLWSTMCESASGHAATDAFHDRTQQADLAVYVDRARPTPALIGLLGLSSVGSRITELYLQDLHDYPPTQLATGLLAFPAPRLERVFVRRRVPRSATGAELGEATAATLTKSVIEMFDGVAPKLKSLAFHDVPLLPSNYFEQLTHLRLSFEACSIHWTLPDLLHLLSQCPSLKDASFLGLPTHLQSTQPPTMQAALLSRLRKVEVGDCRGQENAATLMRTILSHLTLPADCAVRLYGLDAHRLSPFSDLRLPLGEQHTVLSIDVSFVAITLTLASPHTHGSLSLELNTAGTTKMLLQQSIQAFVAGSAASILEVTISSQRVWPAWCDPTLLLSFLRNVTSVILNDTHLVDQCLDALRPCPSGGSEAARKVPCPHLEVLHLPSALSDLLLQKLRLVVSERQHCGCRTQLTVVDRGRI